MEKFRTVHAINVTPFREDRNVDYDLLEQNVAFLIAGGWRSSSLAATPGSFTP